MRNAIKKYYSELMKNIIKFIEMENKHNQRISHTVDKKNNQRILHKVDEKYN